MKVRLALAIALLAPAVALAEENRWNVHLEVGPTILVDQPGTSFSTAQELGRAGFVLRPSVELSLSERIGAEIAYTAQLLFVQFNATEITQQDFSAGVRVRPWYNRDGRYLAQGGRKLTFVSDVVSDLFVDAHVGASLSDRTRISYDVGLGFRVPIFAPLQAGLFVRWRQLFAVGAPDETSFKMVSFGVTLSAGFLPIHAAPDEDGDGVPDAIDRCPGTEPGAAVNDVGCPVAPDDDKSPPPTCSDSDLDGVCDGSDECPDTPLDTRVDKRGCPLEGPPRDPPPDNDNPPPSE